MRVLEFHTESNEFHRPHSEILKLSKIAHLKVLIEQTQIEKSSERFRICVLENLFWDFLNMPVNNST